MWGAGVGLGNALTAVYSYSTSSHKPVSPGLSKKLHPLQERNGAGAGIQPVSPCEKVINGQNDSTSSFREGEQLLTSANLLSGQRLMPSPEWRFTRKHHSFCVDQSMATEIEKGRMSALA